MIDTGTAKNALMVAGRSTANLNASAKKVRNIARKGRFISGHYLDIANLFEFLMGELPDSFKLHIAKPNEFPNKLYEGLTRSDGQILINENVYDRAHDGIGRDRFTMAHELFHWVLHREEFAMARSTAEVPTYRDPELSLIHI